MLYCEGRGGVGSKSGLVSGRSTRVSEARSGGEVKDENWGRPNQGVHKRCGPIHFKLTCKVTSLGDDRGFTGFHG